MRKHVCSVVLIVSMAFLLSGIAMTAPSFFGTSGNILTPDDKVLAPGDFSANFHVINVEDTDATPTILGANVGALPNLEVGLARFDPDDGSSETLINAKYSVLAETSNAPSIVFGVLDVTGEIADDASFYVVFGKNITLFASDVAGEPSKPLRAYLGAGSGMYDGIFAALNWTLSSRTSVIAEYISEDSVFNAGIRFALTNNLRGDLALIDGDDIGFGISYTKIGF